MRYFVTVGDRVLEVELSGPVAQVDGTAVDGDLERVAGTPIRHLLVNGRSYALVAEPGQERGRWDLRVDGHRIEAAVIDERTRAVREMMGATMGPPGVRPVRAPMPGLVIRIEVEPGQTVHAGDGVAIIEAMKMENELKAEAVGVVARVLVEEGEAVEKGAVLVEFEAPG